MTESAVTDRPDAAPKKRSRVPHVPTVVEAVADDIRTRVLDGEFRPGTQLRENDLLDDYGIARHGIRSALHALAHEGLLRHQPHRGVFVPEADPAELADVNAARFALEAQAIRLTVERGLDTSKLAAAADRLDAVPHTASWSELLDADLAVHRAIVQTAGSARMTRIHASLISEVALFLAFHQLKDEQRSVIRPGHRRLIETIIAGDVDRALALLNEDLAQGLTLSPAND